MTNDELKQSMYEKFGVMPSEVGETGEQGAPCLNKPGCHIGIKGPEGPIGLTSYDRPIFEPYVEQMIIEYKQLSEKVDKLEVFLDSPKFEIIDDVMQLLKISQYNNMCAYLGILMLELKHEGVKEKWI